MENSLNDAFSLPIAIDAISMLSDFQSKVQQKKYNKTKYQDWHLLKEYAARYCLFSIRRNQDKNMIMLEIGSSHQFYNIDDNSFGQFS